MKIEIIGKFYDNHSLSIINRNLVKHFDKLGVDFFITPTDSFDHQYKLEVQEAKVIKKYEEKEKVDNVDIQLRHTYPPIWRWPISNKTKIVFIQPWEWSRVPFEWQYKWETFADAIITPSKWSADIYADGGLNPEKLYVIPNGYNPEVFNLEKQDSKFYDSSKYTFVFVGCAQHRKGLDILLNAWKDAFVKADNVQLFIKDNPKIYGQNTILNQIVNLQYKSHCGKIIYNDDQLSDKEMANIYQNSYSLVHPYRGEGFGMHIQEATACGAIPMVTRGGPTDEFIPDNISMKIGATKKLVDLTDPEFFAAKPGDSLTLMSSHGWFLEPSQEELKKGMQVLYHHHYKKDLLKKVKDYKNPNTWENVSKLYLETLRKIYQNGKKPVRNRLF